MISESLIWCSIDNDASRDLDQLTVAEAMPEGAAKILVAIADVDALVKKRSALDDHARHNTTSVYTAAEIFPMLPEKLSTDLLLSTMDQTALPSSLKWSSPGMDRCRVRTSIERWSAIVQSLPITAWPAGWRAADRCRKLSARSTVSTKNLRLQDGVAQKLKALRHMHGALNLETVEGRPVFDGDELKDFEAERKNRAKEIIEDFMIAANGITARYLASKMFPSLRRVVRTPKRWDRIIELASEHGFTLPRSPTQRPWSNSSHRRKPLIRSAFPIFPSASSSSWAPVNTSLNFRETAPPDTSVLRSGIMLTPRRRTAAIPI